LNTEIVGIKPYQIDRDGLNFKFYNFDESYIKKITKDIAVNNFDLSFETHYNAIYVHPYGLLGKDLRDFSCLYSQDGKIIASSKVIRKKGKDEILAPATIEVKSGLDLDNRKFIYIGFLTPHYGHFITESLSRIWFYLLNSDQDYYLLYHGLGPLNQYPLIINFTSALGIDRNRLVRFDKEMIVSEVIVPQQSLTLLDEVSAIHNQTVNTIAENLTKKMGKIYETSQPLYLSRRLLSPDRRLIENEIELEEILIKKGVNVQHLQFLPLEEQIYLINRHQIILGPSGSALHTLIFSLKNGKYFVSLTRDHPIGGNVTQMLIDLLKRNQSSYINCLNLSGSEEENKNIIPWKRNLCMDLDIAISTIQNLGVI
jgi:hypothetical protein